MVSSEDLTGLSRRERQIMDFLFQKGKASVAEVMEGIADPPSYSAVRAMLRTLEQKGRVVHVEDGRAYIYRPTLRKDTARRGDGGGRGLRLSAERRRYALRCRTEPWWGGQKRQSPCGRKKRNRGQREMSDDSGSPGRMSRCRGTVAERIRRNRSGCDEKNPFERTVEQQPEHVDKLSRIEWQRSGKG